MCLNRKRDTVTVWYQQLSHGEGREAPVPAVPGFTRLDRRDSRNCDEGFSSRGQAPDDGPNREWDVEDELQRLRHDDAVEGAGRQGFGTRKIGDDRGGGIGNVGIQNLEPLDP